MYAWDIEHPDGAPTGDSKSADLSPTPTPPPPNTPTRNPRRDGRSRRSAEHQPRRRRPDRGLQEHGPVPNTDPSAAEHPNRESSPRWTIAAIRRTPQLRRRTPTPALQQSGLDSRALVVDSAGDRVSGGANFKLRFDELSDGHRALVVLDALLDPRQDAAGVTLFLDEPHNFLALTEIQPWLLELVDLCDESSSQAVVCSHHPELIDYLGPDGGVLFVRESSTAVSARPLEALATNDGLKLSEQLARGWDA